MEENKSIEEQNVDKVLKESVKRKNANDNITDSIDLLIVRSMPDFKLGTYQDPNDFLDRLFKYTIGSGLPELFSYYNPMNLSHKYYISDQLKISKFINDLPTYPKSIIFSSQLDTSFIPNQNIAIIVKDTYDLPLGGHKYILRAQVIAIGVHYICKIIKDKVPYIADNMIIHKEDLTEETPIIMKENVYITKIISKYSSKIGASLEDARKYYRNLPKKIVLSIYDLISN